MHDKCIAIVEMAHEVCCNCKMQGTARTKLHSNRKKQDPGGSQHMPGSPVGTHGIQTLHDELSLNVVHLEMTTTPDGLQTQDLQLSCLLIRPAVTAAPSKSFNTKLIEKPNFLVLGQ